MPRLRSRFGDDKPEFVVDDIEPVYRSSIDTASLSEETSLSPKCPFLAPHNTRYLPRITMTTASEKKAALNALNRDGTKTTLSSVAVQLGGDHHPYGFERTEPEYVLLQNSSAAAIAADAAKFGIRCWDTSGRQIVKEELAARVFATHKKTMRDIEWFEPSFFGANAKEY